MQPTFSRCARESSPMLFNSTLTREIKQVYLAMSAATPSPASTAAEALISARVHNSPTRVVSGTKAAYIRNISVIEKYFTSELHHAAFNVPVQLPDILNFFGWLIDTHFKGKNAAISTIRLYKSALLWYYKEQKLIVDPLVNQGIETLLKGYQRRVADRKSGVETPTFEGKYHLTYDGYVCWRPRCLRWTHSIRCCLAGHSSFCSGI